MRSVKRLAIKHNIDVNMTFAHVMKQCRKPLHVSVVVYTQQWDITFVLHCYDVLIVPTIAVTWSQIVDLVVNEIILKV